MNDEGMINVAAADGFEFETSYSGRLGMGLVRGDDRPWPCYLEKRQAISWMCDRVNRGRVFD